MSLRQSQQLKLIKVCLDDFSCPVCYDTFNLTTNTPVTLPCGHDLCSQCLRLITKTPKCPKCRTSFPTTLDFRPSMGLLEILRRFNDNQSHDQCSSKEYCMNHQKLLEYVCLTDRQILCSDCLFYDDHSQHNKLTLKDARFKIQQYLSFARAFRPKIKSYYSKITTLLNQLKDKFNYEAQSVLQSQLINTPQSKLTLSKAIDDYFFSLQSIFDLTNLEQSFGIIEVPQNYASPSSSSSSTKGPSELISFDVLSLELDAIMIQNDHWELLKSEENKLLKVNEILSQFSLLQLFEKYRNFSGEKQAKSLITANMCQLENTIFGPDYRMKQTKRILDATNQFVSKIGSILPESKPKALSIETHQKPPLLKGVDFYSKQPSQAISEKENNKPSGLLQALISPRGNVVLPRKVQGGGQSDPRVRMIIAETKNSQIFLKPTTASSPSVRGGGHARPKQLNLPELRSQSHNNNTSGNQPQGRKGSFGMVAGEIHSSRDANFQFVSPKHSNNQNGYFFTERAEFRNGTQRTVIQQPTNDTSTFSQRSFTSQGVRKISENQLQQLLMRDFYR